MELNYIVFHSLKFFDSWQLKIPTLYLEFMFDKFL